MKLLKGTKRFLKRIFNDTSYYDEVVNQPPMSVEERRMHSLMMQPRTFELGYRHGLEGVFTLPSPLEYWEGRALGVAHRDQARDH